MSTGEPEVIDVRGDRSPLSAFLTRLLKGSELGVAEIARRSHLSRSFLYLLMDDQQVPSVDSLVAVFEAAGCEDVRAAAPGEPGDIGLRWENDDYWVRLPHTGNRARRSRNALRTLTSPPSDVMSSRPPTASSAPPSGAMTYDVVAGAPAPHPADQRQRLLGELLKEAGALDPQRLQLLIEHARLMRRG